jgi:hypothetical protein
MTKQFFVRKAGRQAIQGQPKSKACISQKKERKRKKEREKERNRLASKIDILGCWVFAAIANAHVVFALAPKDEKERKKEISCFRTRWLSLCPSPLV